ncbi:MAG: hypothetical protein IPO92_12140 [Saprospiraceae bacterium]|nr:hypothetical protein [Saprospiraceae bacterium]
MQNVIKIGVGPSIGDKWMVSIFESILKKNHIATDIIYVNLVVDDSESDVYNEIDAGNVDLAIIPLTNINVKHIDDRCVIGALSERIFAESCIIVREDHFDPAFDLKLKSGSSIAVHSLIQKVQIQKITQDIQIIIHSNDHSQNVQALLGRKFNGIVLPKYLVPLYFNQSEEWKLINIHPKEVIPEAGQGVLAFVTHKENLDLRRLLKIIHNKETSEITNVERKVLLSFSGEDVNMIAIYCHKDPNGFFHSNAITCDKAGENLKKITLSQSTSAGMAENICKLLLTNNHYV